MNVGTNPPVDPNAVLSDPVRIPNWGIYLALAAHANRSRGQGNPSVIVPYQCSPTITGLLDFGQKLHKACYKEGCKILYDGFEIDPDGCHTFLTALTFKFKNFGWGGDSCGIFDIPTDEFTNLGGRIHEYMLKLDEKFTLAVLQDYMETYINASTVIDSPRVQKGNMVKQSNVW